MLTLYHLSRAWFRLRDLLRAVVDSPFVRLALYLALARLAWTGLSAPAAPPPPEPQTQRLLAWAVLGADTPGASGKGRALELLHREGESFERLDLSCARLGGAHGPGAPCGAMLAGLDLSPVETRSAALREVDFSGADLSAAQLGRADLTRAALNGARLREANLNGVSAMAARLRGADLAGATLEQADLAEADLTQARLDAASLRDAKLTRAMLAQARLERATLDRADLDGADLTGATLAGARLAGATLRLATLDGAEISDADFIDAAGLDTVFATGLWAWSDRPPRNLPQGAPTVISCDPGPEEQLRRAHRIASEQGAAPAGRPEGC